MPILPILTLLALSTLVLGAFVIIYRRDARRYRAKCEALIDVMTYRGTYRSEYWPWDVEWRKGVLSPTSITDAERFL